MIILKDLSKQQLQQLLYAFWRWFPRGVLSGQETIEQKYELAVHLETQYRNIRNKEELMSFVYRLSALKKEGDERCAKF